MTEAELIALWKAEAGEGATITPMNLRVAKVIANAECEACAAITDPDPWMVTFRKVLEERAARIRERKAR